MTDRVGFKDGFKAWSYFFTVSSVESDRFYNYEYLHVFVHSSVNVCSYKTSFSLDHFQKPSDFFLQRK